MPYTTTPPTLGALIYSRLAFGPRPGEVENFDRQAGSDEAKVTNYVNFQLDNYNPDNDTALNNRLRDPAYTTLDKSLGQLWRDHRVNGRMNGRNRPIDELSRAVFLRATYSRWQLVEVLADFWHNHFNVYGYDTYAAPTWVSYDRDVIRRHMLGNFRQMLESVAKSPAMLHYLDNYASSAAGPNENFARELFELHTLGIEHYYGVIEQSAVPADDSGIPRGYVDEDVYEATRCFTGWKVSDRDNSDSSDGDTGAFFYHAPWHDRFQKSVLSFGNVNIGSDQPPLKDGRDVLDLLARHPGTARHIATKLCRRLISDNPPQSVIDAATATFLAERNNPEQLKEVVRTILLSPAFRDVAGWGQKTKRPFEIIVSALRACNANFTVKPSDDDSNSFFSLVQRTGQRPFYWRPPDGYPDVREAWQGSTSLIQSWRAVDWLLNRHTSSRASRPPLLPVLQTTLNNLPNRDSHTPNQLAAFWTQRILGYQPADLIAVMADFMAQPSQPGNPPWPLDFPIGTADTDGIDSDTWPHYWHSRLRTMVGLILASPYAMLR